MTRLSTHLFREVRPDFFRVLSGPLAGLYVDILDALENEASQRTQGLDREEALALVEQTLEQNPMAPGDVEASDDAMSHADSIREKARIILENLRQAGWLQEEERTDWRRVIFFDPNGILLLQALRKIAFPEAVVFSDKLVHVCYALAHRDALLDQPWAQIESCVANLQSGIAELRAMQKSIERHTKQQLAASTLKENLALLFDQFAERIGRTCYAQLVHSRLPSKLAEARRSLDEIDSNADLLGQMQTEVMRREPALSPESAMARVRLRIHELAEWLGHIEPLANVIDRRTAEFTRRSQARFRYLQETTSENRGRVQDFFEILNKQFAGLRLSEIDSLQIEFPALLLHDARIIGGLESLHTPRLRRTSGEIEPLEDSDPRQQDDALVGLKRTMRDSLTLSRANHFVSELPGGKGALIPSNDLLRDHVHNDEDLADIIACLLHARSSGSHFDIRVTRRETEADTAEFDAKLQYRIERFTLVKK